MTCQEIKDIPASQNAYSYLVEHFAGSKDPETQALAVWGLYNSASLQASPAEEDRLYTEIVGRFDNEEAIRCREVVALALNGLADNVITEAKKLWLAEGEMACRIRLFEVEALLKKASDRCEDQPYVLGSRAYLEFLLGDRVNVREHLVRAVEKGGEDLRNDLLEAAVNDQLPIDQEFVQILQMIPAPKADIS